MTRNELVENIKQKKSFLCVGLDTDLKKIPEHIFEDFDDPVFEFNKRIIDATKDYAVAYKPNIAFYESMGIEGWQSLIRTLDYIPEDCFIIADAKRGDIGNTSNHYAKAFFETLKCNGLTVNPYMGEDSVKPFIGASNKFVIVLALTSNPGSANFQMLETKNNTFVFEEVLSQCAKWGSPENMMFVVGATHPNLIEKVRAIVPNHFLLVPGVGAQGGSLSNIAEKGLNNEVGLLVNVSRNIIYASNGLDFPMVAKSKAKEIQAEMAEILMRKNII